MVSPMIRWGRLLYPVSIAALGAEHLIWACFGDPNSPLIRGFAYTPIIPFIPLLPGNPIPLYLTGLALLTAGGCIVAGKRPRLASIFVGSFFLVCVLFLEVPRGLAAPLDVGQRTAFFESLSLSAAAFALAGMLPGDTASAFENDVAVTGLIKHSPVLFGVSLAVFGIDHFLVLDVIARLVPKWIPGALFWAYFTGAAFVASGISIAVRKLDVWGAFWIGTMFLLWFLLLHGPRVVNYPRSHSPAEWSSAFIALAMCGGSWLFALRSSARQPTG
jgi:uncharacterized membrane protein YphA (DoxX/SURF4 family)